MLYRPGGEQKFLPRMNAKEREWENRNSAHQRA
jgi:hypothetical protein